MKIEIIAGTSETNTYIKTTDFRLLLDRDISKDLGAGAMSQGLITINCCRMLLHRAVDIGIYPSTTDIQNILCILDDISCYASSQVPYSTSQYEVNQQ